MFLFVFSDMCKLDLQRARKSELQRHKRMKARDANLNFLREYGPTITLRNEVYFLLVAAKAKQVADLQMAKDVKKEFVKAEKQAARESKEASQKRRVEELTALRVPRAKTEEYTLFVRKLVQEITQGTVKSKHVAGISGMCRESLDELVWKAKAGNVYRGCQGGRPEFMSKPEIREVLLEIADMRVMRDCKASAVVKNTIILQAINNSLFARGRKQLSNDTVFSEWWLRKFYKQTGIRECAAGMDCLSSANALQSPRNAMSYYVAVLTLTDRKYTFDQKDVHLSMRANFDGFTVYRKRKDDKSKVMTVCRKSPLFADDEEVVKKLETAFKVSKNGKHHGGMHYGIKIVHCNDAGICPPSSPLSHVRV